MRALKLKYHRYVTLKIMALLLIFLALCAGCTKAVAGNDVNEKLDLAVKYLSENKFEEAVLAYKEVIEIEPKKVVAYKGLSITYSMMGEKEKAEQALQDGLKIVTDSNELKLAMAGLLLDMEGIKEAEAIYKEIIASNKKYIPVYLAYSKMLLSQDKYEEAVSIIKTAISANKGEYKLHSMLAEIYLQSGDSEQALATIKQSLILEANQSTAYKLIENLYEEEWPALVELADQFNQENKIIQSEILRMLALYHQGEYQDLLNIFNSKNETLKDSPRALLLAAQAFEKLERPKEGIELLAKINVKELKDALLIAELADYYLQNGELKKAWELAIKGTEIDETVAENYMVLYESYQDKNNAEANIWRVKCLMNSSLSVKQTEEQVQLLLDDYEQAEPEPKEKTTKEPVEEEKEEKSSPPPKTKTDNTAVTPTALNESIIKSLFANMVNDGNNNYCIEDINWQQGSFIANNQVEAIVDIYDAAQAHGFLFGECWLLKYKNGWRVERKILESDSVDFQTIDINNDGKLEVLIRTQRGNHGDYVLRWNVLSLYPDHEECLLMLEGRDSLGFGLEGEAVWQHDLSFTDIDGDGVKEIRDVETKKTYAYEGEKYKSEYIELSSTTNEYIYKLKGGKFERIE